MEEVHRSRKAAIVGALPNGIMERRSASTRALALPARTAQEELRSEETQYVRNQEAGIEFDWRARSARIVWLRKKEFRSSADGDGCEATRRPEWIQNSKRCSSCQTDSGYRKQSQPRTTQDAPESERRHPDRSCRIDPQNRPPPAKASGGFFRPVRIVQRLGIPGQRQVHHRAALERKWRTGRKSKHRNQWISRHVQVVFANGAGGQSAVE